MPKYLFGNHVYSPEHESWQRILQKGYAARLRPVCLCLVQGDGGRSLYIALARGQYVLKRLPYSGPTHAPHCDHYEPPPELSGLGQVNGSAIREELETQTTALSLDFALTKGRSRQPAAGAAETEHESVRSDGTKLTMRGLLHFLMDEAALTRWTPAMAGRRSWYVVRRELLMAASSKTAKGHDLADLLYIPESFALERADAIKARQRDALARLSSPSARMILVGEVKAIEDARYGKCLVVKHMPDLKLMMTEVFHKHLTSRFAHQLQLWSQLDASHLVMLATISRSSQGVHALEAACLMNVNEHWIPFETVFEWELLAGLHRAQRRFTKGLRYNLSSKTPLACAVLQDTGDASTALFVVPQGLEGEYDAVIDELSDTGRMQAWQWRAGTESLPELPAMWAERQAQQQPMRQRDDQARGELSRPGQAPHELDGHELSHEPSEPDEAVDQH